MIRTLRVLLSPICNLSCYYCCSEGYRFVKPIFNASQIIEFCNLINENIGIAKVKLSGGEPLLYPEISNIVKDLKALSNVRTSIVTNGTRPDVLQSLLRFRRDIEVILSISALDDNVYGRITKHQECHVSVLDSVRVVKEEEIPFRTNIVVSKKNLTKFVSMIDTINEWNGSVRLLQISKNSINASAVNIQTEPTWEAIADRLLKARYAKDSESRSTITFKKPENSAKVRLTRWFCHENCTKCPIEKNSIWFASDGMLRTCSFGNRKDFRFSKISSKEFRKAIEFLKKEIIT